MIDIKPENTKILPALALRGLVCFPGVMLHFDVGRKKSIKALNAAMERGQKIFLVAQKNVYEEDPMTQGTVLCVDKLSLLCYNFLGDDLCQEVQEKRAEQEYTT